MKFEWDENKNKSNQEKHGIDFNAAKDVFKDENSKVIPNRYQDTEKNIIFAKKILCKYYKRYLI